MSQVPYFFLSEADRNYSSDKLPGPTRTPFIVGLKNIIGGSLGVVVLVSGASAFVHVEISVLIQALLAFSGALLGAYVAYGHVGKPPASDN